MPGPGNGRYTAYVPVKNDKYAILARMYKGSGDITPPFSTGKNYKTQEEAIAEAIDYGNDVLRGDSFNTGLGSLVSKDGIVDTGAAGFGKVDLTYQYRTDISSPPKVPDLTKVTWDTAIVSIYPDATPNPSGGPANAYVPDISSPGPGKTDGIDKNVNPKISVGDIKPGYEVSDNTKSPSETSLDNRNKSEFKLAANN